MTKFRTFLVTLAVLGLSVGSVKAQFAGGDGTSGNPYQLASAVQLAQLAQLVNDGDAAFNDKHYKLMNNIDLSGYQAGEGWTPIGGSPNPFKGNFDGNSKKITGLKINSTTLYYAGLFGSVKGGAIQNLDMEDVNIVSNYFANVITHIGSIAGRMGNNSAISGCYVTGTVSGTTTYYYLCVGGIVGSVESSDCSITNCYSTAVVSGSNTSSGGRTEAGGIAGRAVGTISNCYSTGEVSSTSVGSSESYAGGIGGFDGGAACTITNCYSTGAVSSIAVSGASYAGGIIGGNFGSIGSGSVSNCAALNSSISCTSSGTKYFGRVVGYKGSSITLANNIAFTRMVNPSGAISWSKKGGAAIDGEDISAAAILTNNGTLGNRFIPPVWITLSGYLPGFDIELQMPPHLRYNALTPVITQQPQDATVAIDAAHTFSVTATVGDGGSLGYRWYKNTTRSNTGGTPISGASAATYLPNTAAEGTFYYYVEITNYITDNGNGGIIQATITSNAVMLTVGTTGIAEITADKIKIYPNPTNDILNFSRETTFELIDIQGKVLLKSENAVKSVSVTGLQSGVYFVKLTTETGISVQKIIKE